MSGSVLLTDRELKIASVLRPLGKAPLTHEQAVRAAQLLDVHWTTVYRLRERFLHDQLTGSLIPRPPGRKPGKRLLLATVEAITEDVLREWLPRQREIAHPLKDVYVEVRRRCIAQALEPPARMTVARRWADHRDAQALLLADDPLAQKAPGNFGAAAPLEIVQVDHTQCDVFVVDQTTRRNIGRPWLSVAIDLASRCVVAIYLAMERPNAATVALIVSRIVQPKTEWLAFLLVEAQWPMQGIPKVLHLDNAAEFRSRALRLGCAQYGIALNYRPVGRPQFGGHVERMNRTLMERLRGLPGATGNSAKGRKARRPEEKAALTLNELQRWMALEVAQRYHNSAHRGLYGATPADTWSILAAASAPRQLPPGPDQALKMLIHFMPTQLRSIQADGLTVFYIRYWHPIFAAWRETHRRVRVRYHPEDLSRVYVCADGKNYVEARYADLRRPAVTLSEQRAAVKALRTAGNPRLSEHLVLKAIEQQRQIVARARLDKATAGPKASKARGLRATAPTEATAQPSPWPTPGPTPVPSAVDYTKPAKVFNVEIW